MKKRFQQQPLKLAIDDLEFGPEIRKTRISSPDERTAPIRHARIKAKMEAARALDASTERGRKNRALLELALSEIGKLLDLEKEWFDAQERFILGEWSHDEDFITHDEATLIMRYVIQEYRRDLKTYRIACVMTKDIPPTNGRGRLGTAMKLPGKIRFLSEYHAVVTLDYSHWSGLTDKDRQRLVHHELEHLVQNDAGDGLTIATHDFEDFVSIVQTYGLRSESQKFSTDGRSAEALEHWGAQLELMGGLDARRN